MKTYQILKVNTTQSSNETSLSNLHSIVSFVILVIVNPIFDDGVEVLSHVIKSDSKLYHVIKTKNMFLNISF